MKLIKVAIVSLFLIGSAAFSLAADSLRLVTGGIPNAVIILRREPTPAAVSGAEILSDHLFQISGARLETIREPMLEKDDSRVKILVGETKLGAEHGSTGEGLGPGGILIQTHPGVLVLLGSESKPTSDPFGTRYAVTTFLEKALGIRFLWPGEKGKVVPKRSTIDIAEMNIRFTPPIRQRRIRSAFDYGDRKAKGGARFDVTEEDYWRVNKAASATKSKDGGWFSWHRQGGSLRLVGGHAFSHYWEKYGKDHPEWFALASNGSRDQSRSSGRARFCVSNELIETIAREKIEQLNKGDLNSASIGPNDGGQTEFCTCAECRKLDPKNPPTLLPGGKRPLTDRYVHFWNKITERVVKEHPDAILTADAYGVYAAPPVETKLHPNIAIRFVGVTYTNEEKREFGLRNWVEWAKATKRIYLRSNFLLSGRRQGTPLVYVHKMAKDFRYIANHSMLGTDFDSCCHNWATHGLNYYILAKLLWDPNQDVDVLFNDYCQSGFGKGADSVKKYFLRIEELTNQIAEKQLRVHEPFTPEVVTELRDLLEQAGEATKDDPESNARVAFLRTGLEYTDVFVQFYRLEKEHVDGGGGRLSAEMKQRMREALDRNWISSREVFLKEHLAVNTATVAWGNWSYFARFGWSFPDDEVKEKLLREAAEK